MKVAIVTAISLACAIVLHAGNPRVFCVEARGFTDGKDRVLSGFALSKPFQGIVTSLHGVAGAGRISAHSEDTHTYAGLVVRKVDIPHDLALLGSGEIDRTKPANWPAFDVGGSPPANTQVLIVGHPYGLVQTDTSGRVHSPPLTKLLSIIPTVWQAQFVPRKSPDVNELVLYLQAPMVPGLSGAPVTVGSTVVAVGDGTLGAGSEISWAIPLGSNVNWSDASVLSVLPTNALLSADLADIPPELPISYSQSDGPSTLGEGRSVTTDVAISEKGVVRYTTRVVNQSRADRVCVTPYVAVFGAEDKLLRAIGADQQVCAGIEGSNAQSPPERTETFTAQLPLEALAGIKRIAIVHSVDTKDVAATLRLDEHLRSVVAAGARFIPRSSQKVLILRDAAIPSVEGCAQESRTVSAVARGLVDKSRGASGTPGFEFDVRGNNEHGISDVTVLDDRTVSFKEWAHGKGVRLGVCFGAEGANVSVDVYAWVFDPP